MYCYKDNIVQEYIFNKDMYSLVWFKFNMYSLPWYVVKATIRLVPEICVVILIPLLMFFHFDPLLILNSMLVFIFFVVVRFFKSNKYLICFILLIYCFAFGLNFSLIWKLSITVLNVITMFLFYIWSYFIFGTNSNIKKWLLIVKNIEVNNVSREILIFSLIILVKLVQIYFVKFNFFPMMVCGVVIYNYIYLEYKIEEECKLNLESHFNMFKLAKFKNNTKIFTNNKLWIDCDLLNLVVGNMIIVDYLFNLSNFSMNAHNYFLIVLVMSSLKYLNFDVFVRRDLTRQSVIYDNKIVLHVIKTIFYIPLFADVFVDSMIHHSNIYIELSILLFICFYAVISLIVFLSFRRNFN